MTKNERRGGGAQDSSSDPGHWKRAVASPRGKKSKKSSKQTTPRGNDTQPNTKVPSLRTLSDAGIDKNYPPQDGSFIIQPTQDMAEEEEEEEVVEEEFQEDVLPQEPLVEDKDDDIYYKVLGFSLRIPLPILLPALTFLAISIISFSAFVPCWKARESVLEDTVVVGRKEILEHARLFRMAFLSRVVSEFTRIIRNTMVTTSVLWQHLPMDIITNDNFTISNNLDLCGRVFKPVSLSYTHYTTLAFLVQKGEKESMFYVHVPPNGEDKYAFVMGGLDTSLSNRRVIIDRKEKNDEDDKIYLKDWNLTMDRAEYGKELSFDQIPLWNSVMSSPNETKALWTITNSFILSDVDSTIISYSKKITIPSHKKRITKNNEENSISTCNSNEECINNNSTNEINNGVDAKSDSNIANESSGDDNNSDEDIVGLVCTILTHSKMQELFGSLPVTKNGISFVTDGSPELKMIASRNIDVFYDKLNVEQISSFVHPSPVVREIAHEFSRRVLLGYANVSYDEPAVGEFSIFENSTFVDYEMIPLGEPGHHWWLFVVTPQKDFFEETLTKFAQTERNISYVSYRTGLCTFFIVLLCVIISFHLSSNIRRISKEIENCANFHTDTPQLQVNTMFREVAEICDRTSRLKLTLESYGRYVPMPVVRMGVMASKTPTLEVTQHHATIMFLDVANFTYLSDLFCDRMLEVLNRMFDEFSKILIDHGAVIDKYIGDAIMAFWNVPTPVPNGEESAVRSAVAIMKKLEELNDEVFYPQLNTRMRVRIGINCGTVYAGNVGVPQRLNYTVLGKNVNIAAHLEPFNKELGTKVLVSAGIREACSGCEDIRFRCLGKTCLKGMSEEIVINQLLGDKSYISSVYTDGGMIDRYASIDRKLMALFSRDENDEDEDENENDENEDAVEELKKDYQSYLMDYRNDVAARHFYERMF